MTIAKSSAAALVLVGAGGHAKVMHALAEACGLHFTGVCDPSLVNAGSTTWRGLPVLGGDEVIGRYAAEDADFVLGIGAVVGRELRQTVLKRLTSHGARFPSLVHPSAWVAPDVQLGAGVQIMAGASIQPDCVLGDHCVINTGARVDHDCHLGQDVHVAPGATLCGNVRLDDATFVAAGAVIGPGVHVGAGAIIGANATVLCNVPRGARVYGTFTTPLSVGT